MMAFKAVFDWKEPCTLEDEAKRILENVLINAHNNFSEEINKNLNAWNEEWDKKYKTRTLYKDYDSFMHEMYRDTLKRVRKNDQLFKMMEEAGGMYTEYGFYIGEEFELHLTITTKVLYSIDFNDVSFHLEEA